MKTSSYQDTLKMPQGVEVLGPIPSVGPIEFLLDGRPVIGRILARSRRDICVQMDEPPTVRKWSHVPYFANHLMNFLGAQGDVVALRLAAELARAEWNKVPMIQKLLGPYRDMLKAKAEIPVPALYGEGAISEWRRVKRNGIRNGTVDPKVFEIELNRLRRAHREYEQALSKCQAVFENLLPEEILGQRRQVYQWLEAELHAEK